MTPRDEIMRRVAPRFAGTRPSVSYEPEHENVRLSVQVGSTEIAVRAYVPLGRGDKATDEALRMACASLASTVERFEQMRKVVSA
jgi:hypothetical protein